MNVTAGFDLSIGEFEEVGTAIKEFASDDATVVVGTVIEPEMSDELRVTVVATGIGQGGTASILEDNQIRLVQTKRTPEPSVSQAQDEIGSISVRDELDRGVPQAAPKVADEPEQKDFDYLDIPAFLRRQAD